MSNPAVKCISCKHHEGTSKKSGKYFSFYECLVLDEISGVSGYIMSDKEMIPGDVYGLVPVLQEDYDHKLHFNIKVEEY